MFYTAESIEQLAEQFSSFPVSEGKLRNVLRSMY